MWPAQAVAVVVVAVLLPLGALAAEYPPVTWGLPFGGENVDKGLGAALDADGNSFISGTFQTNVTVQRAGTSELWTSYGGSDAFVAKVNEAGSLQWFAQMGGLGPDSADGVATDGEGNALVAGSFLGKGTFGNEQPPVSTRNSNDVELFLAKLTPSGQLSWVTTVGCDSTGPSYDWRPAVAVDARSGEGGTFVVGSFLGMASCGHGSDQGHNVTSRGDKDVLLMKVSALGTTEWCKSYGGPKEDAASAVTVDAKGDVYVAGTFDTSAWFSDTESRLGPTSSGFYMKVNGSTGTLQWVRACEGGSEGRVVPEGIAAGPHGHVVVVGSFSTKLVVADEQLLPQAATDGTDATNLFVLQVNASTGSPQWARQVGGAGRSSLRSNGSGVAVVVDTNNLALVASNFRGTITLPNEQTLTSSPSFSNGLIMRVGESGTVEWAMQLSNTLTVYANALAAGGRGNATIAVAAGLFEGAGATLGGSLSLELPSGCNTFNCDYNAFLMRFPMEIPEGPAPPWSPQASPPPPLANDPASFVLEFTVQFVAPAGPVRLDGFAPSYQAVLSASIDGESEVIQIAELLPVNASSVLVSTKVIFPPSVTTGEFKATFRCKTSDKTPCGAFLKVLVSGRIVSLFAYDPVLSSYIISLEGDVVTNYLGRSEVVAKQLEAMGSVSSKDVWLQFALVGFCAGLFVWGACIAFDRMRPGKRHAVFFLSLVSVFNFIGDIMYIAGDLQKDASMKVYYFFAVLFLVMYTAFNMVVLYTQVKQLMLHDRNFLDWFIGRFIWAVFIMLLGSTNVELLTLCSCQLFRGCKVEFQDSKYTEHSLAVLGFTTILQDVPQLLIMTLANLKRDSWSGISQISVLGTMLSLSYTLSMRIIIAGKFYLALKAHAMSARASKYNVGIRASRQPETDVPVPSSRVMGGEFSSLGNPMEESGHDPMTVGGIRQAPNFHNIYSSRAMPNPQMAPAVRNPMHGLPPLSGTGPQGPQTYASRPGTTRYGFSS